MIAMQADFEAARLLLGDDGAIHDDIQGMVGADKCLHILAGSGIPVAELMAASPYGDKGLVWWAEHPYRHHMARPVTRSVAPRKLECACGNGLEHDIHIPCWTNYDEETL